LVASKLGRMGLIAAPFAGNVPLFDLLAADESGISIPIQVKAVNGPSWQYSADTFLEIKHVKGKQFFHGKKLLLNPDLICIYIFLHEEEQSDEFFIFRLRDLQEITLKNYFGHSKSRVRPKNPTTTHCALYPKDIEKFRNKWDLIKKSFQPCDISKKSRPASRKQ
jgi:hypothetical protein